MKPPREKTRVPGRAISFTGSPEQSHDATEMQMAELCIRYDGQGYGYRGFRYERLADALAYARLDRERGCPPAERGEAHAMEPPPPPTDNERALMHAHAITFEDHAFHWRGYRDRLADAIAYAALIT